MQIPHRLAYVLERDQELDGAVKLSVAQLEPWIKHSNLPFFPEYTKHDLEHIEAVLRTAAALIRDEAWEAITPGDAAVLILGVLLHDCAMHLVEDGFISLLGPTRSKKTVPGMSDKPWDILWEEFCGEASRFDGRKLIRIFGDSQPIRRPPLNASEMTLRDRLLIGEFLRRHHPRLAQEIALFGVPTRGKHPLLFQGLSGTKEYVAALSGLVARSHGDDVRSFLPYLKNQFDVRQYKGVHPAFLMTVLRVADYIQIESDRAPAQVLQVKQLTSPVSQGEWKAHHAIQDVRHTHEDPEALFVDAMPNDVQSFFKVQSWLRGIQLELDASWAVLGEIYGRYEGLEKLGLVLRRVRSTIDDQEQFLNRVQYLPVKAAFRGSDADLLKLLIEPLYGNRPEIGFRELIQNAVDAVNELTQYSREVATPDIDQIKQEAEVVVAIDTDASGQAWATITDKGIGMNAEIVVDYYLTAGASFRRSEEWRQMFEDSEGKSKVLRAGRFGIGALASFLIGPEIEVSTRRVDEVYGLKFKARIDSEFIELNRCKMQVGTTIRIRMLGDVPADWDWYCLSQPSVVRRVAGKVVDQKHSVPDRGEDLPLGWRRISHPDYADIHWKHAKGEPELVCNGIVIDKKPTWEPRFAKWKNWRLEINMPNVSVFDPDGRLPLNLQRTGLVVKNYPFDNALANDVIRDFIAFALVLGPTSIPDYFWDPLRYPGFEGQGNLSEAWYFTHDGFGYVDAEIISRLPFNSVMFVTATPWGKKESLRSQIKGPTIGISRSLWVSQSENWLRKMISYARYPEDEHPSLGAPAKGEKVLAALRRTGARFLIPESNWLRLEQKSRINKKLRGLMMEETKQHGWCLFQVGKCPAPNFDFLEFASQQPIDNQEVICEVYLDPKQKTQPSPIATEWLRLLKCEQIPYELELRKERFGSAFRELREYVSAYERSQVVFSS